MRILSASVRESSMAMVLAYRNKKNMLSIVNDWQGFVMGTAYKQFVTANHERSTIDRAIANDLPDISAAEHPTIRFLEQLQINTQIYNPPHLMLASSKFNEAMDIGILDMKKWEGGEKFKYLLEKSYKTGEPSALVLAVLQLVCWNARSLRSAQASRGDPELQKSLSAMGGITPTANYNWEEMGWASRP